MKIFKPAKFIADAVKINAHDALFTAGIRLQGDHRPMPPEVEYTHPPNTDHPAYNDSWYFNFFDPGQKIGGFTRIGRLPNRDTSIGILFIYYGEQEVLMLIQGEPLSAANGNIRSGTISYEIIEPLKQLRIIANGKFLCLKDPMALMDQTALLSGVTDKDFVDVEADLTFEGWGEVHNFGNFYPRGMARRMVEKNFSLKDLLQVRKVASKHYEQPGTYGGRIRVGTKEIDLNATGHRDHSWGLREWGAVKSWVWLSTQFGTEVGVSLSHVKIGKVDVFNGYIYRDGRNYPYRKHQLDTEFEDDGLTQKSLRFVVEDTGGFKMDVEGKVINTVPMVIDEEGSRTLVNEAMTEYRWQGKTGYGVAEYLHKIY